VVVDGVTGRLLKPGDCAALEGAVAGLVGDAAARQRMGAAARESVRTPYDWRVMCEQLDALYREIHEH
jgi:glycosyltransferase involved in cell wall biosynthesis